MIPFRIHYPTTIQVITIAILVLVLTAGCRGERTVEPGKNKAPVTIRLITVVKGRLPRTISVTGTLAADEAVTSAFKTAGRVREIAVDLGSEVRQGQILARLDPTDFELRAGQAQAALAQARTRLGLPPEGNGETIDPEKTASVREARAVLDEATLQRDRMAGLAAKGFSPQSELDAALARVLVAEGRYQASIEDIRNRQAILTEKKSELALARQQLADTVLYAPIAGTVSERRAAAGAFLAAGAPVVDLVRLHPLRLRVAVPEREAVLLQTGLGVEVQVEGDPTVHRGRLVRLSPVINEGSRTLLAEAEVDNTDDRPDGGSVADAKDGAGATGRLRPGSFVRAEIVIDAEAPVLFAPARSIVTFAGLEKVLAEKEGRAVERRVRTGRRSDDQVEILEGLAPGDLIVAEPGNLAGGQPVKVE